MEKHLFQRNLKRPLSYQFVWQKHLHGIASNKIAAFCRTLIRDCQRFKLNLDQTVFIAAFL